MAEFEEFQKLLESLHGDVLRTMRVLYLQARGLSVSEIRLDPIVAGQGVVQQAPGAPSAPQSTSG